MRRRLLHACLRAFPRDLRERDGAELRDLADELAAHHGTLREAIGLLRGGAVERWRRATRRRTAVTLGAAVVSVVAVLTWSSAVAAGPGQVEEERVDCARGCASAEREVARRIDEGWACTELRSPASVGWRCTLD